jgi:hypothetical protein
LNRDARIEGNNDPMKPMIAPKISADNIKSGVTLKLKAISLNVTQFEVPVDTKFNGRARMIPIAAPINAIDTDSSRNAQENAEPAEAQHAKCADLFRSSRDSGVHCVHSCKPSPDCHDERDEACEYFKGQRRLALLVFVEGSFRQRFQV